MIDSSFLYNFNKDFPRETHLLKNLVNSVNEIKLLIGFFKGGFDADFKESEPLIKHLPLLSKAFNSEVISQNLVNEENSNLLSTLQYHLDLDDTSSKALGEDFSQINTNINEMFKPLNVFNFADVSPILKESQTIKLKVKASLSRIEKALKELSTLMQEKKKETEKGNYNLTIKTKIDDKIIKTLNEYSESLQAYQQTCSELVANEKVLNEVIHLSIDSTSKFTFGSFNKFRFFFNILLEGKITLFTNQIQVIIDNIELINSHQILDSSSTLERFCDQKQLKYSDINQVNLETQFTKSNFSTSSAHENILTYLFNYFQFISVRKKVISQFLKYLKDKLKLLENFTYQWQKVTSKAYTNFPKVSIITSNFILQMSDIFRSLNDVVSKKLAEAFKNLSTLSQLIEVHYKEVSNDESVSSSLFTKYQKDINSFKEQANKTIFSVEKVTLQLEQIKQEIANGCDDPNNFSKYESKLHNLRVDENSYKEALADIHRKFLKYLEECISTTKTLAVKGIANCFEKSSEIKEAILSSEKNYKKVYEEIKDYIEVYKGQFFCTGGGNMQEETVKIMLNKENLIDKGYYYGINNNNTSLVDNYFNSVFSYKNLSNYRSRLSLLDERTLKSTYEKEKALVTVPNQESATKSEENSSERKVSVHSGKSEDTGVKTDQTSTTGLISDSTSEKNTNTSNNNNSSNSNNSNSNEKPIQASNNNGNQIESSSLKLSEMINFLEEPISIKQFTISEDIMSKEEQREYLDKLAILKSKQNTKLSVSNLNSNDLKTNFEGVFFMEKDEVFIQNFNCAYSDGILLQGKMYLTNKKVVFHSWFNASTLFGKTLLEIPFSEIIEINKKKLMLIDNGIEIKTKVSVLEFHSFVSRNECFKILQEYNISSNNNNNTISNTNINNNTNSNNQNSNAINGSAFANNNAIEADKKPKNLTYSPVPTHIKNKSYDFAKTETKEPIEEINKVTVKDDSLIILNKSESNRKSKIDFDVNNNNYNSNHKFSFKEIQNIPPVLEISLEERNALAQEKPDIVEGMNEQSTFENKKLYSFEELASKHNLNTLLEEITKKNLKIFYDKNPRKLSEVFFKDIPLSNTPLNYVYDCLYNTETNCEVLEKGKNFFYSFKEIVKDTGIILTEDKSLALKLPSILKVDGSSNNNNNNTALQNLLFSYSNANIEDFEQFINWLNSSELNPGEPFNSYTYTSNHPLPNPRFMGPKRLDIKEDIKLYLISPTCFIADHITNLSGFMFMDSFYVVTSYVFNSQYSINHNEKRIDFKTTLNVDFTIEFTKSTYFQERITRETLLDNKEYIKAEIIPRMEKSMKQVSEKYFASIEKYNNSVILEKRNKYELLPEMPEKDFQVPEVTLVNSNTNAYQNTISNINSIIKPNKSTYIEMENIIIDDDTTPKSKNKILPMVIQFKEPLIPKEEPAVSINADSNLKQPLIHNTIDNTTNINSNTMNNNIQTGTNKNNYLTFNHINNISIYQITLLVVVLIILMPLLGNASNSYLVINIILLLFILYRLDRLEKKLETKIKTN